MAVRRALRGVDRVFHAAGLTSLRASPDRLYRENVETTRIVLEEALRAVPRDIRDASLALGASQWQTSWRQVLPSAVSGIATGTILALSRAIGEAAPLILVGATVFVTVNPDGVLDRYTVLPVQIFNLVKLPEADNVKLAWATILLLMIILLAMNALAIWMRNRFQRRW